MTVKRKPEPQQAPSKRAETWRMENAEAIASSNAWIERYGLPLADFRQF